MFLALPPGRGYRAPLFLPRYTHYSLLTHYCSLQVQHFFFRLPIVTHEASPWYPYLLSVYHTVSVPLPFDLRTLGRRSKATQGLYSRPAQSGRSG